MAKAPAGMTGGLSITDMRELMKATDEIDTLAEKTAKQFKVVTDRTDDCRQLLESVMGSFVGSLTGKGQSRLAFDPPSTVKAALIKVSPPLDSEFPSDTTFNNGVSQRIWNTIDTFREEVFMIETEQAILDDTDAQREKIKPLRATMVNEIEQTIIRFTDDVRRDTRDELEIHAQRLLDGLPIPEHKSPLPSEAWRELLYGQQTRDADGSLITTGGFIPDMKDEIREARKAVLDQEALLKRMRVIADKRGKHTAEEKKRLDAIARWETKNAVTLLSDRSVHDCITEIARISMEREKIQASENTAKAALDPTLSAEDRLTAEMAITNANGKARQEFAHQEQTQRRNMTSASDGRRSNALGGTTAPQPLTLPRGCLENTQQDTSKMRQLQKAIEDHVNSWQEYERTQNGFQRKNADHTVTHGFWEFGDIPQAELDHQPDRVRNEKKTLASNMLSALEAYGAEGMLLLSQIRGQVQLVPRGDGTGTPVDVNIDEDDGWAQVDALYRLRMKPSQFVSINYGADLKDTNDAVKSGDAIHHLMTITKPLLSKINSDGSDCHWLETGHEVRTILRERFGRHNEAPKIVEALDKYSHVKGATSSQSACDIYIEMINTINQAFESLIDDKAHNIDDRSAWKKTWWSRHTCSNEHDDPPRRTNTHGARAYGNRGRQTSTEQDRRVRFDPEHCPPQWRDYVWCDDPLHVLGYNTSEEPIFHNRWGGHPEDYDPKRITKDHIARYSKRGKNSLNNLNFYGEDTFDSRSEDESVYDQEMRERREKRAEQRQRQRRSPSRPRDRPRGGGRSPPPRRDDRRREPSQRRPRNHSPHRQANRDDAQLENRGRTGKREREPSPGRFGRHNEYKITSNQPTRPKTQRVLNRIRGHGCTISMDADGTPCKREGNDLYALREYDPNDADIERVHRVCYQCHMQCQKQMDQEGGKYVPRRVICPGEQGGNQVLKVAFAANSNGCMNMHRDGEESNVGQFDLDGTATRLHEIHDDDMPISVSTNGANRSHSDFPNWGAHQTTNRATWPGRSPWPATDPSPWPMPSRGQDASPWGGISTSGQQWG